MDATETDDASIIGEECHIVANSFDGPRGDAAFSEDNLNKYDNLILLCRIHHKLIDDQPHTFTVERIKTVKAEHEQWVRSNLTTYDSQTISISEVAQRLLLKAASGENGYIIMRETVDGFYIKAGREQFDVKRGRESAKYEEAINDLLKYEYISPQDSKGTTFKLTDKGWRVGDKLKNRAVTS